MSESPIPTPSDPMGGPLSRPDSEGLPPGAGGGGLQPPGSGDSVDPIPGGGDIGPDVGGAVPGLA